MSTSYGKPVDKLEMFDFLMEVSRVVDCAPGIPEDRIAMRDRLKRLASVLNGVTNEDGLAVRLERRDDRPDD